jgi:hypothetical protein
MSQVEQSILNKNRKDKFLLVLNLPDALKRINVAGQNVRESASLDLDKLQFSVYGTIIPSSVIQPTALPYSGQTLNLATGKRDNYEQITVNFTVDNTFSNWWVLWKWLNFINNARDSILDGEGLARLPSSPAGYTGTANIQPYQTVITVYGLDEYNAKKIQWTFTKAFITNLTGITYNYKDPEQIESSFSFSFSQLIAELL